MYLTPTDKHWIVDTETNGLRKEATVMWVACVENAITDEAHTFTDMEEYRAWVQEKVAAGCYLVGHNFLAFDAPVSNKLVGTRLSPSRIVDTLVLSMLFSPNLAGGHSIEAWALRLKIAKKHQHEDWSKLSPEMITRCQGDVRINKVLFKKLTERMRMVGFTERGCEIEHLSWNIIQNKQKVNGFPFDQRKAELLLGAIRQREQELKDEIYRLWPPQFTAVRSFAKAYKKDGSPTADYTRHLEQYPELRLRDDGGYDAYDWVEFNLGSPIQRVEKLLSLGWEPTSFTKAGNPQVDEDSLNAWADSSGIQEGRALAKWIVANSRGNMINTWLNAYNPETKAIHGNLWLASTLRYRHDNPNSANIPAVRLDENEHILYGEDGSWTFESRDCWTSGGDDYVLVGIDAKGIQLRCLAHYIPDQAFRERILQGDQHKVNQQVLGLPNKASAKKFFYTVLMGGAGGRLSADQVQFGVNITAKQASAKKTALIAAIPGFADLIASLQNDLSSKGRIELVDGTPILVPSDHMVIPYLLQGDESRIMKQASIYLNQDIVRNKLRAYKVADIHDEWQYRVHKDDLEAFKGPAMDCFVRSGQSFNYNVPIEGDMKVGKTWALTH